MADARTRPSSGEPRGSIIERAIRKFVFRRWTLVWLARDLAQKTPGSERRARRAAAYTTTRITEETLSRLHPYFNNKIAGYRRLLRLGAQGFGAEDRNGVLYGLMWVSTRDLFDDLHYRCWFRIGPGEVFQFAGEIAPERRGGLAASRVQESAWDELLKQGYARTLAVVEADNTHSLRLHFSLGFSERGVITEVYRFCRVISIVRHRRYRGTRFAETYHGKAVPPDTGPDAGSSAA